MVATVQLLIGSVMLAAVGMPIFVWVLYSPDPEWAYEVGAAWNILALFVGGGIVAAAITSCAARGWVFARSRDRAPFAAAVAGPVASFLPGLWLLGGMTGLPGVVYVVLVTVFATLTFWLVVRRLSHSVSLAGIAADDAAPEGKAGPGCEPAITARSYASRTARPAHGPYGNDTSAPPVAARHPNDNPGLTVRRRS